MSVHRRKTLALLIEKFVSLLRIRYEYPVVFGMCFLRSTQKAIERPHWTTENCDGLGVLPYLICRGDD